MNMLKPLSKARTLAIALLVAAALAAVPGTALADDAWNWDAAGEGFGETDEVALDAQADAEVIDTVYLNCASLHFFAGDEVKFTATVPGNAPYTLYQEMWFGDDGTEARSNESTGFTTFKEGVTYTYTVMLYSRTGYKFSANTKLVLNGKAITLNPYNPSGSTQPVEPYTVPEPSTQTATVFVGLAKVPATERWNRLSGPTALETTQAIVREGWQPGDTDTIVVATMGGFYDALAAAPLAGTLNAPIMLTKKSELSPQVKEEIERLGVSRVIIVGGPSAVYPEVAEALEAIPGLRVIRVSGDNAQKTAVEIANNTLNAGGNPFVCVVATSKSYHDALAIAPAAWACKTPLYLTNSKGVLAPETLEAMKQRGYRWVIVMGGNQAIPQETEDLINSELAPERVFRLEGATAIETAVEAAKFSMAYADMGVDGMGVATSGGYHDALAGAALCGKNNSVLVLMPKNGAKKPNYAGIDFIGENASSFEHGYIFGGTAVVSDETAVKLEDAVD